jgi:hypothetical protein
MARKFFYVCAGMFLLALSYHLGASTATAQASGNPVVGGFQESGQTGVITANGDELEFLSSSGEAGTWIRAGNVFAGTSVSPVNNPVAAAWTGPIGDGVATAGGDVFHGHLGGVWTYQGNALSSVPTPTIRESWGQVKARYHASPAMTVTPGADSR